MKFRQRTSGMYHEKIMTNTKPCESVYIIKRNCEFKFQSVTFTERDTKTEEKETTNLLNFTVFLSKQISIE